MVQVRYYDMIHERAKQTYDGPMPSIGNYELWENHWLACAEKIRDEFAEKGLPVTAELFQDIIDQSKHLFHIHRKKKENESE